MKLPLPLYARIAGWFLLNLLLVGVVVYFFTRQHFNLDNLVAGPAGDRITTLAKLTGENLRMHDEDDWPELLDSLAEQHKLKFIAVKYDGALFNDTTLTIPEAIRQRLKDFTPSGLNRTSETGMRSSHGGGHRGGHGRNGLGRGNGQGRGRGTSPYFDQLPYSEESRPVRAHLLFAEKAPQGDYWFAIRVAMGRPHTNIQRPHSVTLLIQSQSLDANGLILNTRPWWKLGWMIVAISILLWIPFAWNLTRYIRRLTKRTISIARGNFEASDINHRGDELGRLGVAIDRLRQRLSGYVDGQKRFTSDIAHELCTPLARMQLSLGVLEQQAKASPETIADLRDEVKQMSSMVDELLDFSRAQISPDKIELETVDLAELVLEVVEREGASSATVEIKPNTRAKASRHLLRRALGNVIRNALRHAGGKDILIHTITSGDTLEIMIDDQGPGIPEDQLPRIFEPFYRVDSARTREDGGTGLGLAIVSTCMEGCNGTASCENLGQHGIRGGKGGAEGGGLRVILTLQLA